MTPTPERKTYSKPNGHKSTVIILRVSPDEKAAWLAAATAARQVSSGWWRPAGLSDWLRIAAARYLVECEAEARREAKREARTRARAAKKKKGGR